MTPSARSRTTTLLLAAGLAAASSAPARPQGPDPFYLDLERSARSALASGDAATAARRLRIACFGLLDAPERLAACLVRLGLAQARLGDREAFARTFERLDGVEERFRVYAGCALDGGERAQFEEFLEEWIAPETLATRPAFASRAWTRLISTARGDLDAGRAENALHRLEGIPATVGDGVAWCLRGEALERLERCSEALSAFAACRPEREARFAAPALACLTAAGRLEDAKRLAAALPAAVRSDRQVHRRLIELEAAQARPKAIPAQPSP